MLGEESLRRAGVDGVRIPAWLEVLAPVQGAVSTKFTPEAAEAACLHIVHGIAILDAWIGHNPGWQDIVMREDVLQAMVDSEKAFLTEEEFVVGENQLRTARGKGEEPLKCTKHSASEVAERFVMSLDIILRSMVPPSTAEEIARGLVAQEGKEILEESMLELLLAARGAKEGEEQLLSVADIVANKIFEKIKAKKYAEYVSLARKRSDVRVSSPGSLSFDSADLRLFASVMWPIVLVRGFPKLDELVPLFNGLIDDWRVAIYKNRSFRKASYMVAAAAEATELQLTEPPLLEKWVRMHPEWREIMLMDELTKKALEPSLVSEDIQRSLVAVFDTILNDILSPSVREYMAIHGVSGVGQYFMRKCLPDLARLAQDSTVSDVAVATRAVVTEKTLDEVRRLLVDTLSMRKSRMSPFGHFPQCFEVDMWPDEKVLVRDDSKVFFATLALRVMLSINGSAAAGSVVSRIRWMSNPSWYFGLSRETTAERAVAQRGRGAEGTAVEEQRAIPHYSGGAGPA